MTPAPPDNTTENPVTTESDTPAEARQINADAQRIINMQRAFIGELRQIIINATGHREDEGVTEDACPGCLRDHMAELDAAIHAVDRRYAVEFPATADGPSRPGRIPGVHPADPAVTLLLPAKAADALRDALRNSA